LDSSLRLYHIHPYNFFGQIFLPRPLLFSSLILMAHTCSQDLEAHFNTLQSGLIETQQEVKQLSANVAAINTTMQFSMGEIKQDLTTQLESVFSTLCTKLHIPTDNPFSSSPPHTEVTIPLIPIPCVIITFNMTYAFHGWM
jgi:hypothetical protein